MITRILIVGYGSIGKRHLEVARKLFPEVDIRVLRFHERKEIPKSSNGCFNSIEDAIKFAPHIAVIANPAPFHLDMAYQLASVGVHLMIEKPLACSADGVMQLVSFCKNNGIVLFVAYNLRFLSSLQYFRDLLIEGVIGKVFSVRCEVGQFLPAWRKDKDSRLSVSAKQELGGGVLLELSHEIDYLRWIFGEIDWVSAILIRQSFLEVDVEDSAHLTLGFEPQIDGRRLVGTLNLDFIRHDSTRSCIAIGEKASLKWDGLLNVVKLWQADSNSWGTMYSSTLPSINTYELEWKHFKSCVLGGINPFINGEDGLSVLKVIDAARKSSILDGKIIKLNLLQEI